MNTTEKKAPQLESKIQAKLIKQYIKQGCFPIKLIKTSANGIPDILLLQPEGKIKFIEVKREDGKLSEIQKYRIEQLQKLGFEVEVIYGT